MKNFEQFCDLEITRTGETAEIIFDYFEGDRSRPVRLIGFATDAELSDFEILEAGFEYYDRLVEATKKQV